MARPMAAMSARGRIARVALARQHDRPAKNGAYTDQRAKKGALAATRIRFFGGVFWGVKKNGDVTAQDRVNFFFFFWVCEIRTRATRVKLRRLITWAKSKKFKKGKNKKEFYFKNSSSFGITRACARWTWSISTADQKTHPRFYVYTEKSEHLVPRRERVGDIR
jgi:hypothetical protein